MKQSNIAWPTMLAVAAVSMVSRQGVFAEGASKSGFTLAQEGKSAAKIVTAQDPCPVIVAAAEELQLHVEKATGARLPVVREGELKADRAPLILVGGSRLTKAVGLDPSKLAFEEFVIHIEARRVILMGRDDPTAAPFASNLRRFRREAGTLLAVHTFLRDYLGIRWYHPGELGTVVPRRASVILDPVNRTVRPRFSPRETVLRCGPGLDVTDKDFQKWARRTRHGGMSISMGHNFGSVVGPSFVQTHPEYFAVDRQGRRAFHNVKNRKLVHLCLSQPGLVDVFVAAGRKYYDASPSNRSFTVMPGDSFRNYCCKCARCLAQYDFDNPNVPQLMQESRYVWGFVNKVAARLRDDYPDRLVFCCAYSRYRLPCPGLRYEPNVAIGVTVNRIGFGYQLGEAVAQAKQWIGVVNHIFMDENYHHGAIESGGGGIDVWDGVPRLCPRRIAKAIKLRAEFVAGEPYDLYIPREKTDGKTVRTHRMWMMDNLNLYVIAELNFDPSQNVDTIIDEYCRDLYGPSADEVKSFLSLLEQRWTETPAKVGIHGYKETSSKLRGRMLEVAWTQISPPDVIEKLFAMLARAEAKAGDGVYLDRVRLLAKTFRYMKARSEACFKTAKPVSAAKASAPSRSVVARRVADAAIRVDGKLDEDVWSRAKETGGFFDVNRRIAAAKKTTFRVLFDDRALCIGVRCAEPEAGKIPLNKYPRDGRCWDDNAVEVFFAPRARTRQRFQIVVNAAGSRYDSLNRDPSWNPGRSLQTAAHVGRDSWSAELVIPFSTVNLKQAPSPGSKWKFKVCRTDELSRPRLETSWTLSLYQSPVSEYGDLWFEKPGAP